MIDRVPGKIEAKSSIEKLYQEQGPKIGGIITGGASQAMGVIAAARELQLDAPIVTVGAYDRVAPQAVREGTIAGTVMPLYAGQTQVAVEIVASYLKNGEPPSSRETYLAPVWVTKSATKMLDVLLNEAVGLGAKYWVTPQGEVTIHPN